jgi:hypothetical protein
MPLRPSIRPFQKSSPQPRGETAPTPVITTWEGKGRDWEGQQEGSTERGRSDRVGSGKTMDLGRHALFVRLLRFP